MPRLRDNVLANYAGHMWVALMGFAFVPAYLRYLGAEQFGMVAFMLSLQSISLLLDFGVGVFLNRELAQRAHDPERRGGIARLIRSFEWLVWPMAAIIAVAIFACSGSLSAHWLKLDNLTQSDADHAIKLIGMTVALLWPSSFYTAALSGLEQQLRLNALVMAFATLRYAGVLAVLMFTDTGLQGFLCWYAIVAGAQTVCSAWLLWKTIPAATLPLGFDLQEILGARHFALGVFALTALGLLLNQLDKLTLSALRPLQEFGYYAIAVTVSGGLGRLVQPMFSAVYPRLSRLVGSGQQQELVNLYHLASQIVAVVIAAIAGVICTYPGPVLLLWTGNAEISSQVALPLALLFAGTAINGTLNLPYALQLAHGWTRLATFANLVSVLIAIPLYVIAIKQFGMTGAASVWFAINLCNFLFGLPLMHRRLLRGELRTWYLHDILPPALSTTIICLMARTMHPQVDRDLAGVVWLILLGIATLFSATVASGGVRRMLVRYIRSDRSLR